MLGKCPKGECFCSSVVIWLYPGSVQPRLRPLPATPCPTGPPLWSSAEPSPHSLPSTSVLFLGPRPLADVMGLSFSHLQLPPQAQGSLWGLPCHSTVRIISRDLSGLDATLLLLPTLYCHTGTWLHWGLILLSHCQQFWGLYHGPPSPNVSCWLPCYLYVKIAIVNSKIESYFKMRGKQTCIWDQ